MKLIPLSKGKFAKVDDEDYEYLMTWKWYAVAGKYAVRDTMIDGKWQRIYMHRVIMKTPEGLFVDHINHDTLNNQKYNLRNCTKSQNLRNMNKRKNCSSKYLGVHWNNRKKRWVAFISLNKKRFQIGCYKSERNAAIAYDKMTMKVAGEFANPNFKQSKPEQV